MAGSYEQERPYDKSGINVLHKQEVESLGFVCQLQYLLNQILYDDEQERQSEHDPI